MASRSSSSPGIPLLKIGDTLKEEGASKGSFVGEELDDDLMHAIEIESPGIHEIMSRDEDPEVKRKRAIYITVSTCILALLVFILIVSGAVKYTNPERSLKLNQHVPVKSVILMISDGFGIASQTMARTFYKEVNGLPVSYQLPLDHILVGSTRTRSSSSLVTDSAAGATAFACGIKTYNTAVGVDDKKVPCGTIMESAHMKGYRTGLVATSRITHATPAAFSSHVELRSSESDIAFQQIHGYGKLNRSVDLMFGGGLCYFKPKQQQGSCRPDDVDLLSEAKDLGWKSIFSRSDFDNLQDNVTLPLMGLFTRSHMSYEIDRDPQLEPSLAEMTVKALKILDRNVLNSKESKGFFLMVEGSRIDMSGHSNDPATHIHDIIAYNEAVHVAQRYVDTHPGTLLISVSDHETGGLSVAQQITEAYPLYQWKPLSLKNVSHSSEIFAPILFNHLAELQKNLSLSETGRRATLKNAFRENMKEQGLDVVPWFDSEEAPLKDTGVAEEFQKAYPEQLFPNSYYLSVSDFDKVIELVKTRNIQELIYLLSELTSKNAEVGWATKGHSGTDVQLYVYGGENLFLKTVSIMDFPLSKKSFNDTLSLNLSSDKWWLNGTGYEQWPGQTNQNVRIRGNHENTDIKSIISDYLNLDTNAVNQLIQ